MNQRAMWEQNSTAIPTVCVKDDSSSSMTIGERGGRDGKGEELHTHHDQIDERDSVGVDA